MELQRAAHALPARPKRRLPLRVLPAMDLSLIHISDPRDQR